MNVHARGCASRSANVEGSMLAGVDIGFDADGCVDAVNKVVHTHYLLIQSQRQLLAHTHRIVLI